MSGQKVLIKWESNWADEMDICGFYISTQSEYDEWATQMSKRDNSFEFYIGSNEDMHYRKGQDLVDEMTVRPIDDIEEAVLINLFGQEFGFTEGIFYSVDDSDDA